MKFAAVLARVDLTGTMRFGVEIVFVSASLEPVNDTSVAVPETLLAPVMSI